MITSWRGCGLLTGEMVVRLGSAQQVSRNSEACMLDLVTEPGTRRTQAWAYMARSCVHC